MSMTGPTTRGPIVSEDKRVRNAISSIGGGLLLAIVFVSMIAVAILSYDNHSLLQQHSVTFAQQKKSAAAQAKYDKNVLAFAETIAGQLNALCVNHVPACPPLPPLPSK